MLDKKKYNNLLLKAGITDSDEQQRVLSSLYLYAIIVCDLWQKKIGKHEQS